MRKQPQESPKKKPNPPKPATSDKEPRVFIDGPDAIKFYGPLVITYHRYGGPMFSLEMFGREIRLPMGRWSPVWLVWALVRKGMEGGHE